MRHNFPRTYEIGGIYLTVSDNVQKSNNIWATGQILQDLDLSLDLLLLNRLQDLDNAFLVVDNVDALEYFGVFAATYVGGRSVSLCPRIRRDRFEDAARIIAQREHTDLAYDLVVLQNTPA